MDSIGLINATHIHICMHVYNNVKIVFWRSWREELKQKRCFYQWILIFCTDGFLSSIMKILSILLETQTRLQTFYLNIILQTWGSGKSLYTCDPSTQDLQTEGSEADIIFRSSAAWWVCVLLWLYETLIQKMSKKNYYFIKFYYELLPKWICQE